MASFVLPHPAMAAFQAVSLAYIGGERENEMVTLNYANVPSRSLSQVYNAVVVARTFYEGNIMMA